MSVTIVGAGLAGCEAAWQAAQRGFSVRLCEMKPVKYTPAHKNPDFAELVCSNSLKAARVDSAAGLMKEEMRRLGSLLLRVADECAAILGVDAEEMTPKAAIVRCLGTCDNTSVKMDYIGVDSCAAAALLYGGMNSCQYGCIGLGDCARECEYHAIELCNELAIVDRNLCVGCGKCAKVCPKQLIEITVRKPAAVVMCSNRDKGAVTRKVCKVGCIGCMKCQRNCPSGAITVENFVAHVDRELCTNCGLCIENCPTHAIQEIL